MVKLWTKEEVARYAEGAIDLYRENVDKHGMEETAAAASAMIDTHEALAYDEELAAGASPDLPFDKPEAIS